MTDTDFVWIAYSWLRWLRGFAPRRVCTLFVVVAQYQPVQEPSTNVSKLGWNIQISRN